MARLEWNVFGLFKYARVLLAKETVLCSVNYVRVNMASEQGRPIAAISILEALRRTRKKWSRLYSKDDPAMICLEHEIRYREATARPRHRA